MVASRRTQKLSIGMKLLWTNKIKLEILTENHITLKTLGAILKPRKLPEL